MMELAIALAAKGRGLTSPNPMVGCVLRDRGRVVAEGFHARFGGKHAERQLLRRLGERRLSAEAQLYLTLEPCSYHGKTPPCVDALLESRIGRFVVATTDPNPRVRGRGIAALRKAGRTVRLGLLAGAARAANDPFFLQQQKGRARVTLKIASTLDGKVADSTGRARWITGMAARGEVGRLRADVDALVLGGRTVRLDDPRLRSSSLASRSPSRIILDSRLSIDPDCRLARLWRSDVGNLRTAAGRRIGNWLEPEEGRSRRWRRSPRLILATLERRSRRRARFLERGWEVWDLPERNGRIDLGAMARKAADEGLIDLLVEPGPALAASFVETGPIDRIFLFLAPTVLGGEFGWSAGLSPFRLESALQLARRGEARSLGEDLLLEFTGRGGRPIVLPIGDRDALSSR